jgi:hypothetical protein
MSPGSPTERPQRKSSILGLLNRTHSMKSVRSAADSIASVAPALSALTVNARNVEANSTKIDAGASPLTKGLLGFKKEKKVPPPIFVVPYQEYIQSNCPSLPSSLLTFAIGTRMSCRRRPACLSFTMTPSLELCPRHRVPVAGGPHRPG